MKNIKGFIETSFVDWPGRNCAVLFLPGCNFRCPFCHNHPLVEKAETLPSFLLTDILAQLKPYQDWLGGICISGGEPTLDPDLPKLMSKLQSEGYALKLDTNGSYPGRIKSLIDNKLVQMISMDVKAPLIQKKYNEASGTSIDLVTIKQSIDLIKKSHIDHEFRMTVTPKLHTDQDVVQWANTLGKNSRLKLQNYNPESVMNPEKAGDAPFKPDHFRQLEKLLK